MNREQLIDLAASAMYEGWRAEENQRRLEQQAIDYEALPKDKRDRWPKPGDRNAMPRVAVGYPALRDSERELWRRRAAPVVERLVNEGLLLAPGEPRLFDVTVDDPDAFQKYEFTGVEAFDANAASYVAAARAVRDDPKACMPGCVGEPDEVLRTNPALIEGVAMYAIVRPAGSQEVVLAERARTG